MILNLNKSIFRKLLTSSILTVLLGLCAVGLVISLFAQDYITDSKGLNEAGKGSVFEVRIPKADTRANG